MFYLLVLTVVTILFLAAASIVPLWVLPVVIIGAVIGLVVIGGLQLRQDGRVSEQGLVTLIKASLRTARSLGNQQGPTQPHDPAGGSGQGTA